MIYFLLGNDKKKKKVYLKKIAKDDLFIFFSGQTVTKEKVFDYLGATSLFGGCPSIIIEDALNEDGLTLSPSDWFSLSKSQTTFVFMEDKLLGSEIKRYSKYGTVEHFSLKEPKIVPKINVFSIADSFARRDKISTWVSYEQAISFGISPEEITGIIFWKIKMMILNGTKFFSKDELKSLSSEVVSIYHRAHLGELDFTISLEQFILSSLNKNLAKEKA